MSGRDHSYELLPFYRVGFGLPQGYTQKHKATLRAMSGSLPREISSYILSVRHTATSVLAVSRSRSASSAERAPAWGLDKPLEFLSDTLKAHSALVLGSTRARSLARQYPAEYWPLLARWRLVGDDRYDTVVRLENEFATGGDQSRMFPFMQALLAPQSMLHAVSQYLLLPKIRLGDDFADEDDRTRTMALLKRNDRAISAACVPHQEGILASLQRDLIRRGPRYSAAKKKLSI